MQHDLSGVAKILKPILETSDSALASEEDVKNKIVLPILKAFGYEDLEFNMKGEPGAATLTLHLNTFPQVS